jgi:hypothetical protein
MKLRSLNSALLWFSQLVLLMLIIETRSLQHQDNNRATETRRGTASPQVGRSSASGTSGSPQTEPPQPNPDQRNFEVFLGISPTGWGAIFTLVIAFAAIIQVIVYRQMLGHALVVERAYLWVPEIALLNFKPWQPLKLSLKLTNTGHLPAHLVSQTITLVTEEPLDTIPTHMPWENAVAVVPPSGSFIIHHPTFIGNPTQSEDEWNRAMSGAFNISIFGAFQYLDGFSEAPRETGYAFFYNPLLKSKPPEERFSVVQNPRYTYMK